MKLLDKVLLEKNIDDIAKYDIDNKKIFGSAYAVFQNGELVLEKCYGTTGANDTRVTRDTLFRLASMTKPITSVATLILVERGLLSLDDTVDKYLPQFANIRIKDAAGKDLGAPKNMPTIRNLLSHTSGIGSNYEKPPMNDNDMQSLDSSIEYFIRVGLDYEPATKQAYSGTGAFDVLTKIIEMVSGEDYLSFLKREIFEPLNMCDTTFLPSDEQWGRMATMHNLVNGENTAEKMREGCVFQNYPATHFLGGAGLVSSLKDYGTFATMLLNKGGELLDDKTFELISTPQVPIEIMNGNARWGLGVRVITRPEYPTLPVGSYGWSGAYGAHFWIDPVNSIVAVFMKNSKIDGGSGNESAVKFEEAVYGAIK